MLPKNLRLASTNIPNIARYGKKFSNQFFDLRAWYDDKLISPKFAISISVKIDKRAVVRNAIKRKLRVAIRTIVKSSKVRPGSYLIVVRDVKLAEESVGNIESLLSQIFN